MPVSTSKTTGIFAVRTGSSSLSRSHGDVFIEILYFHDIIQIRGLGGHLLESRRRRPESAPHRIRTHRETLLGGHLCDTGGKPQRVGRHLHAVGPLRVRSQPGGGPALTKDLFWTVALSIERSARRGSGEFVDRAGGCAGRV
jgi:hypothetical protein